MIASFIMGVGDKILPVELVQKCLELAERVHRKQSPSSLPKLLATKRNAVAAAALPEAFTMVCAAASAFKIRVALWIVAGAALIAGWLLNWWLLCVAFAAVFIERDVAARERRFWIAEAAMLLSAEMLVSDFAGWGTSCPHARRAADLALGTTGSTDPALEWLDYCLPRRSELDDDVVRAFGPHPGPC